MADERANLPTSQVESTGVQGSPERRVRGSAAAAAPPPPRLASAPRRPRAERERPPADERAGSRPTNADAGPSPRDERAAAAAAFPERRPVPAAAIFPVTERSCPAFPFKTNPALPLPLPTRHFHFKKRFQHLCYDLQSGILFRITPASILYHL